MTDRTGTPRPDRPLPGTPPDCARAREDAAVALLTGTDPGPGTRTHLGDCPPCRDEYLELAALPALLAAARDVDTARGPADGAGATGAVVATSPQLLDRLMAEVARQRRRRRLVTAMATAAAVLAVAIPATGLLDRDDTGSSPAPPRVAAGPLGGAFSGSGTDPATGASADVRIDAVGGAGSSVTVSVHGLPGGSHCRMLVHDVAGRALPAGDWVIRARYDDPFVEPVALSPASIVSVELLDDRTGRRIVEVPVHRV